MTRVFRDLSASRLSRPFADRSGAVTVDWVVLTAAIIVLSIGAISALGDTFDTIWDDMFQFIYDTVPTFA